MKQNLKKTLLVFLLIAASMVSLVACAEKPEQEEPQEPSVNAPVEEEPEKPEEQPVETEPTQTPEKEQPKEPEEEQTSEETDQHPVSDEELLRLVELQDTELPAHTLYLTGRENQENGDVEFEVSFRSASGWLFYAVKKYTACFNDDGGRLIAAEALFESEGEKPYLTERASDPEVLLTLVEKMEIGMLGEHGFHFENAGQFTSDELYTAYLLLADEEELQARYNEDEQMYFISWRHIQQVLDRYFEDYQFDITQCSLYDESFDGIVTDLVSGFGGERFIQITNITLDDSDCTVSFTGKFYTDETYQTLTQQKQYRVQFYDNFESGEDSDGYRYLSAMEFVVN